MTAQAAEDGHSIARIWNEEILAAIRIDKPNPPVHARNLFHLGVVMYDCWAAYDKRAVGYLAHERVESSDPASARREAISYAAYRVLRQRYALSVNAATSLKAFEARMNALGFDPGFTGVNGDTPAAMGNRIAAAVLAWGMNDGSNEAGGYDEVNYFNPQPAMIVLEGGVPRGYGIPYQTDPNRWQPLAFDATALFQNGLVAEQVQRYLGGAWLNTLPFALWRPRASTPWIDVGPPSRLGSWTDGQYKQGVLDILKASALLQSQQVVDKSPGKIGNNPLGEDNGTGHALNPVTQKPYDPNPVRLGDYVRVLAEFWADGPHSETPPGHWHVIANQVADHPLTVKRVGGQGPLLDSLEWDVKTYVLLGAAVHDAACGAWSLKRYYEGVRPITAIRLMASLGQSSSPNLPSYHVAGLPLEPGVVELITEQTAAPGGRHQGVGSPGEIAVYSWPGEPENRATQIRPLKWIRGMDWLPYQRKTFVTPAFPGYVSGHSTFSRAAAEVLTAMTGTPFFPGGLGTFTAEANAYLAFERGPEQKTELQWATYYDAADLAGQSRRWGGIHVPEDDFRGRYVGMEAGLAAWNLMQAYWNGEILQQLCRLTIENSPGSLTVTAFNAVRGMNYILERTTDFNHWTAAGEKVQATENIVRFKLPNNPAEPLQAYRVRRQP